MGIADYFCFAALIVLLIMLFKFENIGKDYNIFRIYTIVFSFICVFFLLEEPIGVKLFSIFFVYVGLLFMVLGNYFTKNLGRILTKMYISNSKIISFQLRKRVGSILMFCGVLFFLLALTISPYSLNLVVIAGSFIPLLGFLVAMIVLKTKKA